MRQATADAHCTLDRSQPIEEQARQVAAWATRLNLATQQRPGATGWKAQILHALSQLNIPSTPHQTMIYTRDQLYKALCTMLPSQLETVIFTLRLPAHYLPPSTATGSDRAVGIIKIAVDQQNRGADVAAAIQKQGVTIS